MQAQQVTFDLALSSRTSDAHDAFVGVDQFPMLSVGNWLLDDLTAHHGHVARRPADELRSSIHLVSFVGAMRAQALNNLADSSSFSDGRFVAIAQLCSEQQLLELGSLVDSDDRIWRRYRALTSLELEEWLDQPLDRSPWSHPARVAGLAAISSLSSPKPVDELIDSVLTMLDQLAMAYQIWEQLINLPRDLALGRKTYAISVAAAAAGVPLDPPPRPFEVLGALITSDALTTILDSATTRLESSRAIAVELGLPTLESFLDAVTAHDGSRRERLTGGSYPGGAASSTGGPSLRTRSPIAEAIAMAEAYLLSDLTFRESWETHREGMLGSDEVSSRFPAALVLEVLCRRGHRLDQEIGDFIAHSEANGFRYYDHPGSDPDADTVGAVLRLSAFAADRGGPSAALQEMLACIGRRVASTGEIPVWLAACGDPEQRMPALTLGGRCGTVAAHLLLGLSELDEPPLPMFSRGCSSLFDRIEAVGLGANVNYPPRYALATFLRLLEHVNHDPARATLVAELERRSALPVQSPQEAALAVLAARAASRPELIRRDWISLLMKHQRSDGSWIGEPFAVAPNRGWHVSAYSSTTLTTALCYDALAGMEEAAR